LAVAISHCRYRLPDFNPNKREPIAAINAARQ
jgi:hypothetical protein